MNSPLLLTLRRLRWPLVLLVAVYAIGILGLVLIPGVDEHGQPARMGFFHAFYFLSYTASTIGFGELPGAFTDTQRLWVTVVIYLSVIAWAVVIGSGLALLQDRGFRLALTEQRFRRKVGRLHEPFYIVCGYGETGALVCHTLDRWGWRFTVLDRDPDRIDSVDLAHYASETPALAADASEPERLLAAGLRNPACRGVLALTDDDAANLAVAIAVRLLNPSVPVLARAMSRATADNMASFDTDHVVNPFRIFGETLATALESPAMFRLILRLTTPHHRGPDVDDCPPRGRWVVCGYGRFGREVVEAFDNESLEVAIIDPVAKDSGRRHHIVGLGTEAEPLLAAGIRESVGIVAGTDDDVNNLSIAVTARSLNPDLFVIVRQNLHANRSLFEAFNANYNAVSAEIIAGRCLSVIATPLLDPYLAHARRQPEGWAAALLERIDAEVSRLAPVTWSVTLDAIDAPAVVATVGKGETVRLRELLADPADRSQRLACIPLMLRRAGEDRLEPAEDTALRAGDQLLFAGRTRARRDQLATMSNVNVLDYLRTGRNVPGGWIWRRLARDAGEAG
jgi:voltage-gated potassium channel Kch